MTKTDADWITVQEAAKLAGVTEQRIRQLCAAGKLGCRKFGRVWQVDKRALQEWKSAAGRDRDTARCKAIGWASLWNMPRITVADPDTTTMTDDQRTAYHEAGHAVMHCLLGVPFKEVSIVESERSKGHITWNVPMGYWHSGTSQTVECIMCLVAGWVAGERVGQNQDAAEFDHEQACLLADQLTHNELKAEAFVDAVHESAKLILQNLGFWTAVEAVAYALLVNHTVSDSEVQRIVREYSGRDICDLPG